MSGRWEPKCGEDYYFIDAVGVVSDYVWRGTSLDRLYYESGNCFKTEAKAQATAEKVKALLLSLHEPATKCSQLPKLTAEVFDRPDCPEWAQFAAVDQDGAGAYFESKPSLLSWCPWWDRTIKHCLIDDFEKWDASDWQNSLVERPAKKPELPEWCKVGEWCFCLDDDGGRKYFKITKIKDNFIYGEDWNIDYHFVKQARIRPYNADEMRGLVGVLIRKGQSLHIVTGYENALDGECMIHVNGCLYNANDLLRQFAIDNEPCGVLEHLDEKGEWWNEISNQSRR